MDVLGMQKQVEPFKIQTSNIQFPGFVQFETDNVCQARCRFCTYKSMKRKHHRASWSQLLRVIDECAPLTRQICPFLMQEPFLEPRLIPLLRNIKQLNHRCRTSLFSNMAAVTPEKARTLIKSRTLDNLTCSFYGPDKQTYELLQPPLHYETTMKNIRYFIKYRNRLGLRKPLVKMHYIVMPDLMSKWKTFFKTWTKIADSVGLVHYDNFHGDLPDLDSESYWGPPAKERMPCSRVWSSLTILSNGDVVPCCIDYEGLESMGNVNEKSVNEIWNGKRYTEFRQMMVEQRMDEVELCRECTVWKWQHPKGWDELCKKIMEK